MTVSRSRLTVFIFLVGIFVFLQPVISKASIFSDENRYFIPAGDTINDDIFVAAEEGVFDGVVSRDLIVGAKKYIVSGEVLGSIISVSQYATLRGKVGNSARVFAQNVIIDGEIGNNLLGMGSVIDLSGTSLVSNDVTLYGNEISVSGDIGGNLLISGGQVIISGKIDGDLDLRGNKISIVAPAEIKGDIKYRSKNKIKIDDEVIIDGEVDWEKIKPEDEDASEINWALKTILFFCALATGLIMIPLCNRHTKIAVAQVIDKPLVSLGVGFVSVCIAPVAIVLLCITVVGAPAGIILLFAFTIFVYVAKVYIAIVIGRLTIRAFRKGAEPKTGWSFILGLIILTTLFALPTIGWVVYIVTIFFGIGAILLGVKSCRELAGSAAARPAGEQNIIE